MYNLPIFGLNSFRMKKAYRYTLTLLLALAAASCRQQYMVTDLVVRGDITSIAIENLPAEIPAERFGNEIYGPVIYLTANQIPPGLYTVEIDEIETWADAPGKRTMSVFCNGELVTPQFDIFQEAGGKNIAFTKTFEVNHPGGSLNLKFEAIENNAKFHAVRIKNTQGRIMAQAIAGKCKTIPTNDDGIEFRMLQPEEYTFYHADHSPVGAYATLIYGKQHSGGLMAESGRVTTRGVEVAENGLIIGYRNGSGPKVMPFYKLRPGEKPQFAWIDANKVHRKLSACTDSWTLPEGISWAHYSPVWRMANFETALPDEQRQFLLPATVIRFTIDNTSGKDNKEVVFSLQEDSVAPFESGNYSGYAVGTGHYLVSGQGKRISAGEAEKKYGVKNAFSAFEFTALPGTKIEPELFVIHYNSEICAPEINGVYYYSSLFDSPEAVLDYAVLNLSKIVTQAENMDAEIEAVVHSEARRYLIAHSMHSYRFNTFLLKADNEPVWGVAEGQYGYINTFDLVVDQLFYELELHPWTIRNVLDLFADRYFYYDSITADGQTVYPGGLSFCHDMGMGVNFMPAGQSRYENAKAVKHFMSQEELQNWIICAAGYYAKTRDLTWLQHHSATISACLLSMQNRDHPDPASRDGITDFITTRGDDEITTYDALDAALKQTRQNLYIAVKSWASYLMLEMMFNELNMNDMAELAHKSAKLTAGSITKHFNTEENYFPAIFDGQNTSRIIPAIEALVYPFRAGMSQALSPDGEYGELIHLLKIHFETILKPGQCIDASSRGWKLSSTSSNTWQSKVYICQYVAEKILQCQYNVSQADAIHASFQILGAGRTAWSDQLNSFNGKALGSKHYPRGVTSALWWCK